MDKAEVKEFVRELSPALRPKIAIGLAEVDAEEADKAKGGRRQGSGGRGSQEA